MSDSSRPAPNLAVIIPVKDEEKIISRTVEYVVDALRNSDVSLKVICVDDGSSDRTWNYLCELTERHAELVAVRLSRNFGHDAALFAGMQLATTADAVITMDADGQHPFSLLPRMVEIWQSTGCNIINGVKRDRGEEQRHYSLSTFMFSGVLSRALDKNLVNATEFKLLDREALNALTACGDRNVFYRALVAWIGFRQETLLFDVSPSMRGFSHWHLRPLIRFAVNGLVTFSDMPIRLLFWLGAVAILISLVLMAKLLWAFVVGEVPAGYSTLLSVMLLNLGFMMFGLGVIGIYVRATLLQTLGRPRSFVQEIRTARLEADNVKRQ